NRMKKALFIVAMAAVIVSCSKDGHEVINPVQQNPDETYAKTEFNLDLRDFALAVNEAINTNASFRILVKEEALKMFDGDYDVLLSRVADKQVSYGELDNGASTPDKVKANFTVRDLLEDAYSKLNADNRLASPRAMAAVKRMDSRQQAPSGSLSLIDELTEKYPELQISVPVHIADLEDESYIPPVVFVPYEANETTTKYLPAFGDNEMVVIDAIDVPESAVIVIGMNERLPEMMDAGIPPTPTNLTAYEVNGCISLAWTMPSNTNSQDVSGYHIFRKIIHNSNNEPYTKIASITDHTNRTYLDVDIANNTTYGYYVQAFNSSDVSDISNQIFKSINRANAAVSFSATPESLNSVTLKWLYANGEYNGNVKIYKRQIGTTSYGEPIVTLPMPVDSYFDRNIIPGQKVEYKLVRVTPSGTSLPNYDFVYNSYRDISQDSKVLIKQVKYSDISKIESWWKGAPEFIVKVLRVVETTTVSLTDLQINMSSRTDNKWNDVDSEEGTVYNHWKPSDKVWYDSFSFYFVELDGWRMDLTSYWQSISLVGQKFAKIYIKDEKTQELLGASLEAINATAKVFGGFMTNNDDAIGYVYLNYYDPLDFEFTTNSAPKGGKLTVKFGND
ncbi:MAG: hypothetical protein ACK5KP_08825, partial [Paludibacteraceae bacterium]